MRYSEKDRPSETVEGIPQHRRINVKGTGLSGALRMVPGLGVVVDSLYPVVSADLKETRRISLLSILLLLAGGIYFGYWLRGHVVFEVEIHDAPAPRTFFEGGPSFCCFT